MKRTVLVTGGSGFIGSHVVRALAERGHRVINIDLREPQSEAAWWLRPVTDQVQFVRSSIASWSDVVSAVKTYQPQAVVHIAGIVNPVLLAGSPSLAFDVNLTGTYHVLESCRLFGVSRVIYFSSIAVLPSVRYEPIDANHPIFLAGEGPGASFYAATKVAGEALCWAYHQSFGLDFFIIRPSAVYGFGMQWPIFVKPMVENSVAGLPTKFDHGREFPRDYTHVADVAELAVKTVEAEPQQGQDRTFYAATGHPLVTTGELAEVVSALVPGAKIEVESGLSDADKIEIRYRGVLSIDNARKQLGYEPRFGDVRVGIADYIEKYRQYQADK